MNKVVVDASVIIKWLNDEDDKNSAPALKLYSWFKQKKVIAQAPSFCLIEISNILLVKKQVPRILCKKFLNTVLSFLDVTPTTNSLPLAELKIMESYGITAYDALYVALAEQEQVPLITLDKELLRVFPLALTPQDYLKKYQAT